MRKYGKGIRFIFLSLIFINVCGLSPLNAQPAQKQEEDDLRRVWNKKFVEGRQKDAIARPVKPPNARPAKSSTRLKTRQAEGNQAKTVYTGPPAASSPAEKMEGELIGVTLWQLADVTAKVGKDKPRISLRQANG